MVSKRQLPESYSEEAKQEFPKFISMLKEIRENFIEFDVTTESHCLDTFYRKFLEGTSSLKKLGDDLKIILILSHCQASVERGFIFNNSMLVENLATKNLIAQRIVYNYMKVKNVSAEDVEIFPTLGPSVKHARQRYSSYLSEQKKSKVQNDRLRGNHSS